MLKDFFAKAAGTLLGQATELVDEFHLSAEEKNAFTAKLDELVTARFAELQATIRARYDAVARIIVAEQEHGDGYTRRARPTVVYFGLVLYGAEAFGYATVPAEFAYAWGGICGAWVLARSGERIARSTGKKNGAIASAVTGSRELPEL